MAESRRLNSVENTRIDEQVDTNVVKIAPRAAPKEIIFNMVEGIKIIIYIKTFQELNIMS